MNLNKQILMTIVKNSSSKIKGEQEILEINEIQLKTITRELKSILLNN